MSCFVNNSKIFGSQSKRGEENLKIFTRKKLESENYAVFCCRPFRTSFGFCAIQKSLLRNDELTKAHSKCPKAKDDALKCLVPKDVIQEKRNKKTSTFTKLESKFSPLLFAVLLPTIQNLFWLLCDLTS